MTSLPCTCISQSGCSSPCLLDEEMSGLMSCRCPHRGLLPVPEPPSCLGNAFLSNLKSLLPLFTQTELALLPILIAQPLSVPIPEQIHLVTAEPFLAITCTAFLCVLSETLGVTEAFGVSWSCNPALSGESGPAHTAMWGLGKEQVATSRRREADGSLSPCVKGIDEYSGTGKKQERCLNAGKHRPGL